MAMPDWVRLPSRWIEDDGLQQMRWGKDGGGADNIAALMALAVIAHHADAQGLAKITYDQLCAITGLSRAKLSNGLDLLAGKLAVIERMPQGRSTYRLTGVGPSGWAKLPVKRLYASGRLAAFDHFKLRSPTELNALKLYFLFAARRNSQTNMANISYDKITSYTGIDRARIKPAISFLASIPLVYVEQMPSSSNEDRVANSYRLVGLDPYWHQGTRGRTGEGIEEVTF